ncbi:putative toxin-antitoxin system toxin component, PIN family [Candidatus Microgenomates bacterium]|nr:putative toxin-antitoxin system toxin component, PIN family [Candidatus Microgenomates bacterium]
MLKVVLDTNNFVSSQISKKGASAKIYHLWRERKIGLLTSPFQLKELEKVLEYPRIKKKYRLSSAKVKKIVKIIRRQATVVYPFVKIEIIKEDPADNQILAIAQEGKADYIISGDQHLLKLKKFKNIPIITAKEFLEK